MNSIYNQYLTSYAPKKSDSRFDTHKRSELRQVYNSMVKVNRDAPLYILENNPNMREYIVSLKEESRELHNTIVAVTGDSKDINLNSKIAFSSNESVLSATYAGGSSDLPAPEFSESNEDSSIQSSADNRLISKNGEIPSYEIEVHSLASPQVNLGNFLPENSRDIRYGEYSFDVNVGDLGYEFQFNIQPDDTNLDIQKRISRLINNSGIGLSSSIESDGEGNHALQVESLKIGLGNNSSNELFSIKDNSTVKFSGSVNYLGIDYVAKPAENASFTVNGKEATSNSNQFTLDDRYEIILKNISPNEGQTVTVGIKPDTEALQENIHTLLRSYNHFIKGISEYQEQQKQSNHLLNELNSLSNYYHKSFEKIGINKNEKGEFSLNTEQLNTAVALHESKNSLSDLKQFSSALLRKTNGISLNPINYVNKKIVAYKNPDNSLTSPYVSSAYAGMMFNGYC